MRLRDYHTLLIVEAVVGRTDGLVDPIKMAEITGREVIAGRMIADDEVHKLALAGAEVMGPPYPQRKKKKGIFGKLFS
jgi:hypothetical protein